MTITESSDTAGPDPIEADQKAADVAWDISDLLDGRTVDELLDAAAALANGLIETGRGHIAETDNR
jgi:hypothetical protein